MSTSTARTLSTDGMADREEAPGAVTSSRRSSVVEPLHVHHGSNCRDRTQLSRPAERPGFTKGFCGFTTAEKTRAMPCRKRDRLVQKEQLCPAATSHHVAMAASKFAQTGKP